LPKEKEVRQIEKENLLRAHLTKDPVARTVVVGSEPDEVFAEIFGLTVAAVARVRDEVRQQCLYGLT